MLVIITMWCGVYVSCETCQWRFGYSAIIKSYIIGKHANFFSRQIKGKINFFISKNLRFAVKKIFTEIKNIGLEKEITILLSPASASYDQYRNFEERGNEFKRLVKLYGKNIF